MIDRLSAKGRENLPMKKAPSQSPEIKQQRTTSKKKIESVLKEKPRTKTNRQLYDDESRTSVFKAIMNNIDDDVHLKDVLRQHKIKYARKEPFKEETFIKLEQIFRAALKIEDDDGDIRNIRFFSRPALCILAALIDSEHKMTEEELHKRTGYALTTIRPYIARAKQFIENAGMMLIEEEGLYWIEE
jgi:hypothetical protein